LVERFGQSYIFKFGSAGDEPVVISAIFWYALSLLIVYLVWFLIKKGHGRLKKTDSLATKPASEQT
jgi:hypothetical protein